MVIGIHCKKSILDFESKMFYVDTLCTETIDYGRIPGVRNVIGRERSFGQSNRNRKEDRDGVFLFKKKVIDVVHTRLLNSQGHLILMGKQSLFEVEIFVSCKIKFHISLVHFFFSRSI